jgi:hypothetical protein
VLSIVYCTCVEMFVCKPYRRTLLPVLSQPQDSLPSSDLISNLGLRVSNESRPVSLAFAPTRCASSHTTLNPIMTSPSVPSPGRVYVYSGPIGHVPEQSFSLFRHAPAVQANWLAPPDSSRSISACVKGSCWKRGGSSERSKNKPLPASMGPRSLPDAPPM